MPRKRRDHEDHLESIEPIGVVVLNDLAYLLEDASEIVLDLAKLLTNRPDDVRELFTTAKESGPGAVGGLLPQEILEYVMQAGMELFGKGMQLKSEVAGEEGGLKGLDPSKVQPGPLESFGKTLHEKATGLQEVIATFEAKLLEENPPPSA